MPARKEHADKERLKRFAAFLNEALDDLGAPENTRGRVSYAEKLFNTPRSTVNRWMNGTAYPRQGKWPEIADNLNVRFEWLFFDLGPKREIELTDHRQEVMIAILDMIDDVTVETGAKIPAKMKNRLSAKLYEKLPSLLSHFQA